MKTAVCNGNIEVVQLLLDKGADVNAQGGTYRGALKAASRDGNVRVVQLLLDKGVGVNAQTPQGGYYSNALQAALRSRLPQFSEDTLRIAKILLGCHSLSKHGDASSAAKSLWKYNRTILERPNFSQGDRSYNSWG